MPVSGLSDTSANADSSDSAPHIGFEMSTLQMIQNKQEFVGGLNMPKVVRIFPPSIRLRLTEDSMEFRVRYGLHHFVGPWKLERQRITNVYREQRGLNLFHGIGIVSDDGR